MGVIRIKNVFNRVGHTVDFSTGERRFISQADVGTTIAGDDAYAERNLAAGIVVPFSINTPGMVRLIDFAPAPAIVHNLNSDIDQDLPVTSGWVSRFGWQAGTNVNEWWDPSNGGGIIPSNAWQYHPTESLALMYGANVIRLQKPIGAGGLWCQGFRPTKIRFNHNRAGSRCRVTVRCQSGGSAIYPMFNQNPFDSGTEYNLTYTPSQIANYEYLYEILIVEAWFSTIEVKDLELYIE